MNSSDAPDAAVEQFREPLEKLRRLELASNYVQLLKEVDDLADEARACLPADPKEALKPYTRLKQLSLALHSLRQDADEAAIHLVTYIDRRTVFLWDEMKKIMSSEFEAVLQEIGWPNAAQPPTRAWAECFVKLLDLQAPEFKNGGEGVVLLPFTVMVKPFRQQFRFHFMGDKPTNSKHNVSILSCLSICIPCSRSKINSVIARVFLPVVRVNI